MFSARSAGYKLWGYFPHPRTAGRRSAPPGAARSAFGAPRDSLGSAKRAPAARRGEPTTHSLEWRGRARPRDANFLREDGIRLGRSVLCQQRSRDRAGAAVGALCGAQWAVNDVQGAAVGALCGAQWAVNDFQGAPVGAQSGSHWTVNVVQGAAVGALCGAQWL